MNFDFEKIATKNRTRKNSPDCSGYVVEHSGTTFERKAGPKVKLKNKCSASNKETLQKKD